jgi:hypothetical protein
MTADESRAAGYEYHGEPPINVIFFRNKGRQEETADFTVSKHHRPVSFYFKHDWTEHHYVTGIKNKDG